MKEHDSDEWRDSYDNWLTEEINHDIQAEKRGPEPIRRVQKIVIKQIEADKDIEF